MRENQQKGGREGPERAFIRKTGQGNGSKGKTKPYRLTNHSKRGAAKGAIGHAEVTDRGDS
jgi:hypothetical protein